MKNARRTSRPGRTAVAIIAAAVLLGAIGTMITTFNSIDLADAPQASTNLTVDEAAYYDYVAPRLNALVDEVDTVTEMVDGKSRDILALTRSGTIIERLTGEIGQFGDEHGVPARFANVHQQIVDGSVIVNDTFDEARQALTTFNFSNMTTLVPQFHAAGDTLRDANAELTALANDAS